MFVNLHTYIHTYIHMKRLKYVQQNAYLFLLYKCDKNKLKCFLNGI